MYTIVCNAFSPSQNHLHHCISWDTLGPFHNHVHHYMWYIQSITKPSTPLNIMWYSVVYSQPSTPLYVVHSVHHTAIYVPYITWYIWGVSQPSKPLNIMQYIWANSMFVPLRCHVSSCVCVIPWGCLTIVMCHPTSVIPWGCLTIVFGEFLVSPLCFLLHCHFSCPDVDTRTMKIKPCEASPIVIYSVILLLPLS
jgi:hypothetical protein